MLNDVSAVTQLLIVAVLIGLNGFFVATEFALVSVRRTRIEELVSEGSRRAARVQRMLKDLDRYIAGTQVGITLASLALGWIGEPLIAQNLHAFLSMFWNSEPSAHLLHTLSFAIAFLGITMLHVVLGELVPKSLALQQPEAVALAVARPMTLTVVVLHPFVAVLNGIGNFLLKILRINASTGHHNVHSVEELKILVEQSHEAGVLEETEREVLQNSFRFADLTARDVMVRRVDVFALNLDEPVQELLDAAAANIRSRVPAYVESLDNIVGILHIHDLFRAVRRGPVTDLRPLLRPSLAVPENIHLDDLLDFFRENHTQIVVVIDEHGGTAGIVTFEDVVEEVTGEVQDELESEQEAPHTLDDGRVIIRGDLRLDEVNSVLGWSLVDNSVDTVAGFIMHQLGRVARVDDVVETEFGSLKVIDMARMRITRLAALSTPKNEAAAEE